MEEIPDLSGQRALIMGASGETAMALAMTLAEAGCDLGLTTATPDAEEAYSLRPIVKRAAKLGRKTVVEVVDMAIGTSVQVAMKQITKELGGLDLLVVAPDLRLTRPAERLGDAEWSRLVGGNLSAVFFACRSAARELMGNEPPGGRIVILTTALEEPPPGEAAYYALRGGIEALVRALAAEWREHGILLNAVALPEASDELRAETAAAMVSWLASEADRSLSGQLILAAPV